MTKKIAILTVFLCIFLIGCAKKEDDKIVISEQFGVAYAPVQIMKELKLVEKYTANSAVEYVTLPNTAAIREGMLAGNVDVGFMAIPPYLIGLNNGMEWQIATGLSQTPLKLLTNREDIKSLKDFKKTDKIAVPQPGSVQHILLAMAAKRELLDAKALDLNLATLAHPDALVALLAKSEIVAHFSAPPYSNKELETAGISEILTGEEAFGGNFTFIVGVSTNKFHDERKADYDGFLKATDEAINFINEKPEEAAKILAPIYNMEETELLEMLKADGNAYSTEVFGLETFAEFMEETGYID